MIGTKIREKRAEIEMSMKDLADKTGLTSGFISQVESGLAEPSIASLRNIAKVLNVPAFYFLLDDMDINPVVKKDERRILKFPKSQLTYELLSPDLNRQIELFRADLKPGVATSQEAFSHSGEEVVHIIQGAMKIELGDDRYSLEEGDTIHFNCSKPHRIISNGEKNLVFISATTPPAELDTTTKKGQKK